MCKNYLRLMFVCFGDIHCSPTCLFGPLRSGTKSRRETLHVELYRASISPHFVFTTNAKMAQGRMNRCVTCLRWQIFCESRNSPGGRRRRVINISSRSAVCVLFHAHVSCTNCALGYFTLGNPSQESDNGGLSNAPTTEKVSSG